MTAAGNLRDRITIQRKTGGKDAWGTPLPEAWVDFHSLWASVRHQSGAESIRSGADTSVVKASIRVRWRADLDASMRVLHLGMTYDIEAVLPGAKREYVDLVCKRVT